VLNSHTESSKKGSFWSFSGKMSDKNHILKHSGLADVEPCRLRIPLKEQVQW
jgi:hypothetical protein